MYRFICLYCIYVHMYTLMYRYITWTFYKLSVLLPVLKTTRHVQHMEVKDGNSNFSSTHGHSPGWIN